MATAIKAIPTLHGEDAIRFREEMEANERAFLSRSNRDRNPQIRNLWGFVGIYL